MREHHAKTQNKKMNLQVFLVNGTRTKNKRKLNEHEVKFKWPIQRLATAKLLHPPTCHVRVS